MQTYLYIYTHTEMPADFTKRFRNRHFFRLHMKKEFATTTTTTPGYHTYSGLQASGRLRCTLIMSLTYWLKLLWRQPSSYRAFSSELSRDTFTCTASPPSPGGQEKFGEGKGEAGEWQFTDTRDYTNMSLYDVDVSIQNCT